MTNRALCVVLPLALLLTACEAAKSSNPLSPSVAGPIPGVDISAPKPLEPNGAQVAVDKQPVTLLIENAASTGVRPLSYDFEVAIDAGFTNTVFTRQAVEAGSGGRTSIRLPDALATDRSYYWRARAADGANSGPYSAAANFKVYTPVVIEAPTPTSPIGNATASSLQPTFSWTNARRTGPAGVVAYVLEMGDSDSFANKLAVEVAEQPNATSYTTPSPLPPSKQYYWHVRAYEATSSGPWSGTQTFTTPAAPPPTPAPPPAPDPRDGSKHVGPGPLTVDRAQQVVFATAAEFPQLFRVFGSDSEAEGAAQQALLRTIWHLQLAGYQAARQRNPSGAISGDKLNIYVDGGWHAYDIYSLGFAGRATTVQFFEVTPASPLADPGIPD